MKKIKSIKKGSISRNIGLLKLAVKTGSGYFLNRKVSVKDKLLETLANNSPLIAHELNLMKGSVMKFGQVLSQYLGDYFPEEIKKLLNSLENKSYFLGWEDIKKSIPREWLEELEFEKKPYAAASIGQVHLAKDLKTSQVYAVKIQYPGIKKAIDKDIAVLKFFIKSLKIIPKGINLNPVYDEVKMMLKQEMDYKKELNYLQRFTDLIKPLEHVELTAPVSKYCNESVLTTIFADAHEIRSHEVSSLSQEQRNQLGISFLDLFYREIFEWELVQSDGHFGNYLIKIDDTKASWVLLDFGATKEASRPFIDHYKKALLYCSFGDKENYFKEFKEMGFNVDFDEKQRDTFWDYLNLLAAPFKGGSYGWGKSDIADQVLQKGPKLMSQFPIDSFPQESLYLDRKVASVFFMLRELNACFDPTCLIKKYQTIIKK
jgi:predicted unusual protein kinase regulating ubiquinone biosynthesis (AarF/ABC1/UbiB family)